MVILLILKFRGGEVVSEEGFWACWKAKAHRTWWLGWQLHVGCVWEGGPQPESCAAPGPSWGLLLSLGWAVRAGCCLWKCSHVLVGLTVQGKLCAVTELSLSMQCLVQLLDIQFYPQKESKFRGSLLSTLGLAVVSQLVALKVCPSPLFIEDFMWNWMQIRVMWRAQGLGKGWLCSSLSRASSLEALCSPSRNIGAVLRGGRLWKQISPETHWRELLQGLEQQPSAVWIFKKKGKCWKRGPDKYFSIICLYSLKVWGLFVYKTSQLLCWTTLAIKLTLKDLQCLWSWIISKIHK